MPTSLINPEKILGSQKGNIKAFQNFMTGGAEPLGANILKSASNNIVGFNRANVSGAPPEINSIISNISTNILNTVNNSVEGMVSGIQTRLQDGFNSIVTKFSTDYQNKLKSTEDNAPRNILGNFLKLYKDAIGFITFFGNSKNIDRVSKSLKSLRVIFNDSFEVAKLIRQTIQKIVKQLTNLPTASGGRSGLNIDIDVPGGPLKKSGASSLGKFLKIGGKVALAAGGVAAAGVGLSAAAEYQKQKLEESRVSGNGQYSVLEEVADIFTKAVNKFTNIIQSLFSGNKGKGKGSASSGSGAKDSSSPQSPGSPGSGDMSDITADTPEEKALIATVRSAEGTSGSGGYNTVYGGAEVPELTKMTLKELYDAGKIGGTNKLPSRLGGGIIPWKQDGHNSTASGAVQIMPETLRSLVDSGVFSWTDTFSPETQNKMIIALAKRRGVDVTKPLSMKEIMILRQEWAGLGRYYAGQGGSESEALKNYNTYLSQFKSVAKVDAKGNEKPEEVKTEPTIRPRLVTEETMPGARGVASRTPSDVSAVAAKPVTPIPPPPPPTATESSKVNYITLPDPKPTVDATAPQTSGGGNDVNIPSPPSPGPGVPFLSPSNPDNFYIHLSALTLNLVNR